MNQHLSRALQPHQPFVSFKSPASFPPQVLTFAVPSAWKRSFLRAGLSHGQSTLTVQAAVRKVTPRSLTTHHTITI